MRSFKCQTSSDSAGLALVQQSSIIDLFSQAEELEKRAEFQQAADLYKTWIAWNSDSHLLHASYFNYAVALGKVGDRAGAINALRECIRLKPDFYPPYINLGRIFEDAGQAGSAVAQWMALVNSLAGVNGDAVKHKLMALQQLGRVLENNQNDAAAEDALKQSLEISSSQIEVIQHWIALRQRQCKWPVIAGWENVDARSLLAGISSLSLANLTDDPIFQLSRAWRYIRDTVGVHRPLGVRTDKAGLAKGSRKLRIGYVSSDLREHAVGFGMTDVFEMHDRGRFEICAYYCGIDRVDPTQVRIRNNVDRWVDLNKLNDQQAALKIAEDGIDILVDLNGYTKDARTKVFAQRPAPIIANWFGFPGSMGSPYHHYIIADRHIIPDGNEMYYSEKVLRLPCYQPNDRRRRVADATMMRRDEQLPDDAFVYCSLNGMQKITPTTFQNWMTIVSQVPGSVLWLLAGTHETNSRLRQIAEQSGVSPGRLVFAEKKSNPEHLARYRLADIFLDTFPYGAHTTAADAMWMGVPVLTMPGRGFASRVCASLVRAAGLDDLVCPSADVYVARAIEFGRSPDKMHATKRKLIAGRDTCLLFDTPLLVRHLEDLYCQMWREFKSGSLPVPDLTNLDVYHDIGVELSLENVGALPDDVYWSRYAERLVIQHQAFPIRSDSRLWRQPIRAG
jgi:predicted O-linked N-acetylglucosamine transferase (SPINDLY family)